MKTPIAALWEQIEASYGIEARHFLKGFYYERSRAYQQNLRNEEKKRQEEARAFYAKRAAPALEEVTSNPEADIESFFKGEYLGSEFLGLSNDGDDALAYDIEINRDEY